MKAIDPPEVRAEIANTASSFCIAPWVQLHIATNGRAAPCCEYAGSVGSVNDTTIAELWSSEAMREIRAKFLSGQPVKECWKCFDRESGERFSMRHAINRDFSNRIPEDVSHGIAEPELPAMPVKFDIRFSNVCNFRCRTCWHGSSSKWFADGTKIGLTVGPTAEIRSFDSVEAATDQLAPALPTLEELYFAGGEPLITNEHYALLNMLVERGLTGVRLSYNTNLSMLEHRGESVLALWNRFADVWVSASVDAAGEQGELIRKDFRWERFVRNIQELRSTCPHIKLKFRVTVSALNVFYLTDLFDALIERCGASPAEIDLHCLQEPGFYSIRVLTPRLKRSLGRSFQAYGRSLKSRASADDAEKLATQMANVRRHMLEKDETPRLPEFRHAIGLIDKVRDEESGKTLHRLAPLLAPRHPVVEFASALMSTIAGSRYPH